MKNNSHLQTSSVLYHIIRNNVSISFYVIKKKRKKASPCDNNDIATTCIFIS